LSFSGELDGSSAPFLKEKLDGVTSELVGGLVLDIALLSFIDSSGLALFVVLQKQLEAMGANLVTLSPTPMARRLFQITALTQVLTIEPPDLD
jgi:anti-anti-sigma factor